MRFFSIILLLLIGIIFTLIFFTKVNLLANTDNIFYDLMRETIFFDLMSSLLAFTLFLYEGNYLLRYYKDRSTFIKEK
jgi:hypothetical protein